MAGEEWFGFDVDEASLDLDFRGLPFRFRDSAGSGRDVGKGLFGFDVDEASLGLDFRGRPLRFRGSTGSGNVESVETFGLDRLDSVGLSVSSELDWTSARLRGPELGMLGGVAGGVPSSESDESSVDEFGGSGVTLVLRLLVLM